MRVSTDVLAELDGLVIEGNNVRIANQLDPGFYKKVDKVLQAAGGKWNRKAKAHIFNTDPADVLEQVLLTGQILTPQDFGYFPTPPAVVEKLIEAAKLRPGMTVLEPSAGTGAIVGPVVARGCMVSCVEAEVAYVDQLMAAGAEGVAVADFLAFPPPPTLWDRVIMNPPFARQADIHHVTHALTFLKPDGFLAAVMSNGVTFRTNPIAVDFRALVDERGGRIEALPDDAFKESGTGVRTVMVVIPA